MTICIASDGFPPQVGGIATFNKHLAAILVNAGHKVIVLYVGYNAGEDEEDAVITEGMLTRVILKSTYFENKNEWKPYFKPGGFDAPNWIAMGLSMKKWLLNNYKQYAIDIIEVSDYGGCGIFLHDAALPPIVITGHGSLLQYSRYNYTRIDDNYTVVRKLEELSFIHADSVIAHSPLNKTDLENLFHRKIELARIPWHNEVTNIEDVPLSNNKLVVVGGMQPIKGIYTMADAMQLLSSKGPDIELSWIGGDTWLAPGQHKMSAYLSKKYPAIWQQAFKWKDQLSFEATRKEMLTSSIVIVPSFFETFNYVGLEAAAMSKPIIITNKTGASYLFTHGQDAWIIPADDPAALADAILYLRSDPALCQTLGDNAAKMVNKLFDEKALASERINIYRQTIQNRISSPALEKQELAFLKKYKTAGRKLYYKIRNALKRVIRRN